jgi:hypothetical protein
MVPILNSIGTDVACVGVSFSTYLTFLSPSLHELTKYRTTTLTSASSNSATSHHNAPSLGS